MVGPLAVGLLVARLFLVGIFAVAGISKLRDRHGTWAMLRAFGAGVRTSNAIAPVLPFLELGAAIALVPTLTAAAGAIAALALLVVFSAAIAVNLALGRKPECRCFGSIGNAPIGASTLVRNGAFCLLGAAVLLQPPATTDPPAFAFLAANVAAVVATVFAIALVVVSVVLWQVLMQQGRMLARLDSLEGWAPAEDVRPAAGLALGTTAPDFALPDLEGNLTTLAALRALGKPVGLFFVHPTCGPCRALVPYLVRWSSELGDGLTMVIVSEGAPKENIAFLPGFAPNRVVLQAEHAVADAYAAYGTPAAVIVDPSGAIASEVAGGRDAIARLVGKAADTVWHDEAPAVQVGLEIGSPAPEFAVPTTLGTTLRSSELRGEDVALVFWSPACGFCRQAAEDLIAWEAAGATRLVVVSSAPDDDLVARGLKHPIALDEGMRVGHSFGAGGTPMAIRIAADGTIASKLAAGRDAIGVLLRPSAGIAT
jgi:thiol-disulfide isomerase/thioredoxin/uncharacterized membrane protein YphA (DoxX/SURF4 family)